MMLRRLLVVTLVAGLAGCSGTAGSPQDAGSPSDDARALDGSASVDAAPQADASAPGIDASTADAGGGATVGLDSCGCPTDHPRGIYTCGTATSSAPGIDGALRLGFWSAVEATEGVYDFTSVDSLLSALPAGQHAHLSIFTAGSVGGNNPNGPTYGTPTWLLNALAAETPSGISDQSQIPIPTDATYLAALQKLVAKEGALYGSDCRVCYVDATGPTGRLSWQDTSGATWPGYDRAKVIAAWEQYIDWLLAAFPTKMFTLPIQIYNDSQSDGGSAQDTSVAKAVIDYINTRGAAGRFATFYEAWSATAPSTAGFTGQVFTYAQSQGFRAGFQEVAPLGTSFRAGLDFAFTTWGATYLEVYVGDINPTDVAYAHAQVWAP